MLGCVYYFLLISSLSLSFASGAEPRARTPVLEASFTQPGFASRIPDLACEWKAGSAFLAPHEGISVVLAQLKGLDWYFARELEREIRFLRFCLTDFGAAGVTNRIPVAETSAIAGILRGKQSVAYRYLDTAYLDRVAMDSFSPSGRALLVLHTVIQSYLDSGTSRRAEKLAAFLTLLRRVESGTVKTRSSLHGEMKKQQIQFPRTVGFLEPHRRTAEFILGSDRERKAAVLAESRPEVLIGSPEEKILPYLAEWDQQSVPLWRDSLADAVARVMADGSEVEFRAVLLEKSYSQLKPTRVAIDVLSELSPHKRAMLFESEGFATHIASLFAPLHEAKVVLLRDKLSASPALQALGAMPPEAGAIPLVEVFPRVPGEGQMPLPEPLQELAVHLALLVNQGEWEQIERFFFSNSAFFEALGLKPQFAVVLAQPESSDRAKAIRNLNQIRDGLIARFEEELKFRVGREARVFLDDAFRRNFSTTAELP